MLRSDFQCFPSAGDSSAAMQPFRLLWQIRLAIKEQSERSAHGVLMRGRVHTTIWSHSSLVGNHARPRIKQMANRVDSSTNLRTPTDWNFRLTSAKIRSDAVYGIALGDRRQTLAAGCANNTQEEQLQRESETPMWYERRAHTCNTHKPMATHQSWKMQYCPLVTDSKSW
jgi:hypothetical protein